MEIAHDSGPIPSPSPNVPYPWPGKQTGIFVMGFRCSGRFGPRYFISSAAPQGHAIAMLPWHVCLVPYPRVPGSIYQGGTATRACTARARGELEIPRRKKPAHGRSQA